jgi:putative acetyltransferase
MPRIVQADTKELINHSASLFREYASGLSVNLSFQNFEKELAELPGGYAPPEGRLLLAFPDENLEASQQARLPVSSASFASSASSTSSSPRPAGCIALRKTDSSTCEMKRLYVRPEFRGHRLGRTLALAAIQAAREIGYQRMRLDTLPEMAEAQVLYRSLGFKEIPPYRFNPIPGTRYLELDLAK